MRHTVIFANGELREPNHIRDLAALADLLIAADGGLTHLLDLQLQPNLLIGDLDSVTASQISAAEKLGCEVRRFPVDKNETDLELALLAAAELGCTKITVVAALGGRLDQTLANLHLLDLPQLSEIDVRIEDGFEEVFIIRGKTEFKGSPGDLVSLLPLSPIVEGVSTQNLKYPLVQEDLGFHHTRGISNVMLSSCCEVSIRSGILLCIHHRKEVSK